MEIISKSVGETEAFARKFLNDLKARPGQATVLALKGDLGSGKTTFTQFLAKILGVKNQITSPTFVIEKKYPIKDHPNFKQLIHIDSYRLNNGTDLLKLDWSEILADPKNLIVIEWPEIVPEILPADCLNLEFEFVSEGERRIRESKV